MDENEMSNINGCDFIFCRNCLIYFNDASRKSVLSSFYESLNPGGIVFLGHTPMILYMLMAVAGIGWAAVVSLPFAIMTEKIDQSRTGFFMGIFNLSVVLPQLLVSLFFGTIIKNAVDKNIIFIMSGVSLALSALFWMMVKEKRIASIAKSSMPPSSH